MSCNEIVKDSDSCSDLLQLKRDVNSLMHFKNKILEYFPFIYNHVYHPSNPELSHVSRKDNMSQTTKDSVPESSPDETTTEDTDVLYYLLDTIYKRSLQLSEQICIQNHRKNKLLSKSWVDGEQKPSLSDHKISTEEPSYSSISNILNESSPAKLKRELFVHIASTERLVSRFWDHVKALEVENTKLKFELEQRDEELTRKRHSIHTGSFYSSPPQYSRLSIDDHLGKYKIKSKSKIPIKIKPVSPNKKREPPMEETSSTESCGNKHEKIVDYCW